jgi:hypothetical protein
MNVVEYEDGTASYLIWSDQVACYEKNGPQVFSPFVTEDSIAIFADRDKTLQQYYG